MNRAERLTMADAANSRAAALARAAEKKANTFGEGNSVAPLAAAGALWAEVARAHAAIAQAMTDTEEK